MAIRGSITVDVDESSDRDSIDLLARILGAMADRLDQIAQSDIFVEYAGEVGARRTFGHSEQITRARMRAGDGAFFGFLELSHLDDPNVRLVPE